MDNEQAKSLRERRLTKPVAVSKSAQLFDLPEGNLTNGLRRLILEWIGEYTSGEFYLSVTVLYFCDEKDAMAYKLYDVTKKFEMFNTLRTDKNAHAGRI